MDLNKQLLHKERQATYFSANPWASSSTSNLATQSLRNKLSPLASVLSVGKANSISNNP